jgi:hypothetical protein
MAIVRKSVATLTRGMFCFGEKTEFKNKTIANTLAILSEALLAGRAHQGARNGGVIEGPTSLA